jgi:hypothetical protein
MAATLAGLAAVTVFAQLDLASVTRPALVSLVPKPFRSASQPTIAVLAIGEGNSAKAQAEARQLVRRRPLPSEHLLILALADLRSGNMAGYARAFELSTERGWRAAPVQLAAARAALGRGSSMAAANRIAALWALDASQPALHELTSSLLQSSTGRRAFAAKLAGTRVWQDSYLQRAGEFAPAAATREVILEAIHAGAQFDCERLAALEPTIGPAIPAHCQDNRTE